MDTLGSSLVKQNHKSVFRVLTGSLGLNRGQEANLLKSRPSLTTSSLFLKGPSEPLNLQNRLNLQKR